MNPQDPPAEDNTLRGQLESFQARMERFEAALGENTKATKEIQAGMVSMAILVEVFSNFQAAFKVFNWIGMVAKPVGYIATAVAAVIGVWLAVKEGFVR